MANIRNLVCQSWPWMSLAFHTALHAINFGQHIRPILCWTWQLTSLINLHTQAATGPNTWLASLCITPTPAPRQLCCPNPSRWVASLSVHQQTTQKHPPSCISDSNHCTQGDDLYCVQYCPYLVPVGYALSIPAGLWYRLTCHIHTPPPPQPAEKHSFGCK